MKKYEVGVVRGNLISIIYNEVLRVIRTWRYAKSQGFKIDGWYGVYEAGTNIVIANCGPLPTAQQRAEIICEALNDRAGKEEAT